MFDLIGGIMRAVGANRAADAVNKSIDANQGVNTDFFNSQNDLSGNSFAQQRGQLERGYQGATNRLDPYARAGIQANSEYLNTLMNPGQYQMSPAAQFQMAQGIGGMNNSAMARGGMTGNTLAAMNQYGQGVASQDYNQRLMQLMQASQMGQGAANQLANLDYSQGQNMAQNYGQQFGFDANTNATKYNNIMNMNTARGNNEASRATGTFGSMANGIVGTGNSLMSLLGGGLLGGLGGRG